MFGVRRLVAAFLLTGERADEIKKSAGKSALTKAVTRYRTPKKEAGP